VIYFIEFWHENALYFRYKPISLRENLPEYAREIIRGFFEDDAATPRIIMPDSRIPSEIRIVDENGNILAQRSLIDEMRDRQQKLRDQAARITPPEP
jgi:hypothetical protein